MLTVMEIRRQYADKLSAISENVDNNVAAFRATLMQDVEAKCQAYEETEKTAAKDEIDAINAKIKVLDDILAEFGIKHLDEQTSAVVEEIPKEEVDADQNPLLSQISSAMATKIPDRPGMAHITVPTR